MKSAALLKYILMATVLISCGEKKAEEEEVPIGNPNIYRWTQPIKPATTYDEDEMTVASNVCLAFQRKRAFVASRGGAIDLNFQMEETACGRSGKTTTKVSGEMYTTRRGQLNLEGESRGVSLMTDVLSDLHERLEPFCDAVLRGIAPTNTVRDGSLRYQVTFFQGAGLEWVQIAEFSEKNGVFLPYLIERAAVSTPYYNQAGAQTHGFVKLRFLNYPCGGDQGRYRSQELLL